MECPGQHSFYMHPSTNRLWRKVSQLIILYVVLKSCYSIDFSWILQNILKEWNNHKPKNLKPLPDPYPHVQSNHWWHCDTLWCPIPQTIAPHRNILLSNFQSTPKYVVKWARHRSVELIASSAARWQWSAFALLLRGFNNFATVSTNVLSGVWTSFK